MLVGAFFGPKGLALFLAAPGALFLAEVGAVFLAGTPSSFGGRNFRSLPVLKRCTMER